MNAITIYQPWATLIAIGAKSYETRTWRPNLKSNSFLAIHAAKQFDMAEKYLCLREPVSSLLNNANYHTINQLPTGAIVAIAKFQQAHPTNNNLFISNQERALGNFSPNRYAWQLKIILRLEQPIPTQGQKNIWNWPVPASIAQAIDIKESTP